MLADKVQAEWVCIWLKGRNKKNIKSFQLAINRVFGFIDTESCEAVFFDISQIIKDRKLYSTIQKFKEFEWDENSSGQMFRDWLIIATSRKTHAIPQDGQG